MLYKIGRPVSFQGLGHDDHLRFAIPPRIAGHGAVIIFQKIKAPGGDLGGIIGLMPEAAGQVLIRFLAAGKIDAGFEPLGMNIVGERLYPPGKRAGLATRWPLASRALAIRAVIHADVAVAGGGLQARGCDGIRGLPHHFFVRPGPVGVVTVPPHRRRVRQTVVGGGNRQGGKRPGGQQDAEGLEDTISFHMEQTHRLWMALLSRNSAGFEPASGPSPEVIAN